jgi:hypothetical protein
MSRYREHESRLVIWNEGGGLITTKPKSLSPLAPLQLVAKLRFSPPHTGANIPPYRYFFSYAQLLYCIL